VFLFGIVFEQMGASEAALSRIESTALAIGLRGAGYLNGRKQASWPVATTNGLREFLTMFVDVK
jgi:hypothetical protein